MFMVHITNYISLKFCAKRQNILFCFARCARRNIKNMQTIPRSTIQTIQLCRLLFGRFFCCFSFHLPLLCRWVCVCVVELSKAKFRMTSLTRHFENRHFENRHAFWTSCPFTDNALADKNRSHNFRFATDSSTFAPSFNLFVFKLLLSNRIKRALIATS